MRDPLGIGVSRFLGEDHGLAREVVERPAIEAAEDLDVREAGSGEQVLELIAEEMTHPGPHALALGRRALAPALVAERHLRDLACRVSRDTGEANDLGVPLPPACLLEFRLFKLGNPFELRRKDVEGEEPSGSQVPPHGGEAGELILHCQQVLEGAERGEDEGEAVRPEIEVLHAARHEPQIVRRPLAPEFFEHRLGGIQARARNPVPGDRKENPTGAAPELEHRPARLARQAAVEVHVSGAAPKELEGAIAIVGAGGSVGVVVWHGAAILTVARSPLAPAIGRWWANKFCLYVRSWVLGVRGVRAYARGARSLPEGRRRAPRER